MAYGGSQARGLIGATAAGLCHSHSHARSQLHLRPTPQLKTTPDPWPTEQRILSCPGEVSLCSVKVFNRLHESHSHCGGQSAWLTGQQFKYKSHPKTPSQKHSQSCLTKYLDTMAQPSWHITVQLFHLVSCSTGMTPSCNISWQESVPSYFTKKMWCILLSWFVCTKMYYDSLLVNKRWK